MKYGQLREHNMRNTFLKKLYSKYGGIALGGDPFLKNKKLIKSLDQ